MMKKYLLILGDIVAIALTTLIGFATHGEADLSFLPRMLAAFLPLTFAWFLLAPWFGLFQSEITSNSRQVWRAALAMVFTAPLAGVFRGLILQADIVPIFIIVLGATSAFGMVIWRGVYFLLNGKAREER